MEIQNKVAIVTGVSKGIGLATVQILLEKGMKVAGWGRTAPDIDDENFTFYETDVRDFKSVEKSFKATTAALGDTIAVLVNNAGLGYAGPIDEMPLEEWHQMYETNVNGVFYCSRLVIAGMKEADEGHIFNIASIAGTTGIENMAGYCGSKHAVRGISHSMYKELRNFGIKVTAIYPGSVKTNFFDDIDGVEANDNMMRPEDIALTMVQALESHPNFHHVDIELRPLRPKGKQ